MDNPGLEELLNTLFTTVKTVLIKSFYAAIVLIIGYVIGRIIGSFVRIFLDKFLGVDEWLKQKGLSEAIYNINIVKLFSSMVSIYVYLYAFLYAFRFLELKELEFLVRELIMKYPLIVSAIFIILGGMIFGDRVKKIILESGRTFSEEIGSILKILIIIASIGFSLDLLGISTNPFYEFIRVVMYTVSAIAAISLGLGLGLALKEELRPYIREYLQKKLGKK